MAVRFDLFSHFPLYHQLRTLNIQSNRCVAQACAPDLGAAHCNVNIEPMERSM